MWEEDASGAELGGVRAAVDLGALGSATSERRRNVRCRVACAVCARLGWSEERSLLHLWRSASALASGTALLREGLVGPGDGGRVEEESAPSGLPRDAAARRRPRDVVAYLLSPERYAGRWRFDRPNGAAGGIPLEELRRSSVRDPDDPTRGWLLHRKVVPCERRILEGSSEAVWVGLRDAPAPFV